MEGSQSRFNPLTRHDKNERNEFVDITVCVLLFNWVHFDLKEIDPCVKVNMVLMWLREVIKRVTGCCHRVFIATLASASLETPFLNEHSRMLAWTTSFTIAGWILKRSWPLTNNFLSPNSALTPLSLAWSGEGRGQNAAEDAAEAAEDGPLHRAGQLSALAGAHPPEDKTVHLRTNPSFPQREPLHHRWLQGSPALQALPEEVRQLLKQLCVKSLLHSGVRYHLSVFSPAVFSFCPMRRWISGATFWVSCSSSLWGSMTFPQSCRPLEPTERTMSFML